MCLIRVRAKLCRNGPDLRIPGLNYQEGSVKLFDYYLDTILGIGNFLQDIICYVYRPIEPYQHILKYRIILHIFLKFTTQFNSLTI